MRKGFEFNNFISEILQKSQIVYLIFDISYWLKIVSY